MRWQIEIIFKTWKSLFNIRCFQFSILFYKNKITKCGNRHLRQMLYFMMRDMIHQNRVRNNHFVEYYDK
ncbi:TPA: hypothetical protein ROX98_002617 [Bacillus pseudomycoides]|nr:hypothetical protein [Bacillus pseudomycoides]